MEREKRYVLLMLSLLVLCIVPTLALSHYLFELHISYSGDDVLKEYQFRKLYGTSDASVVIVGDSSVGNAIDAQYFSELIGKPTLNLALTGGDGLIGTYNMIRHALQTQPKLETVVIVQSYDMWRRDFNTRGYIDTLRGLPPVALGTILGNGKNLSEFQYAYSPQEVYWYIRYRLYGMQGAYALSRDYIEQSAATYANGLRKPPEKTELSSHISPQQIRMFSELAALCTRAQVTCVYLHGPIHADWYHASTPVLEKIAHALTSAPHTGISISTQEFVYDGTMMGDSKDHIARAYRGVSTEAYAAALRDALVPHE